MAWLGAPSRSQGTVLFQACRSLASAPGYHDLGEKFEDLEQNKFGQDDYGKIVSEVINLEEVLNLENLSQVTPKI